MKTHRKKRKKASKSKATLEQLVEAAHKAGMRIRLPMEPCIPVQVSPQMERDLQALVQTGLYGIDVPDAARRLLEQALIQKLWLIRNEKRKHETVPTEGGH